MKVIGLTGPSGSGKGWVCERLSLRGIPSVDTDAVYHSLLLPPSECLDELRMVFGNGIINNDGTLRRSELAKLVFSDKARLAQLNAVTHKYILAQTDMMLASLSERGFRAAVVDAPALFEAGYDAKCDFVIAVVADRNVRMHRIMERDGLTETAASLRIDGQQPDDFYTSRAKYTVHNDGNSAALETELDAILAQEKLC